jgi:threonine/homoserine/homoserine lactone efflux protein
MPPFFNGLLFGLIFLFALGPAFFALIQTSLQQGYRKAIFFAIGISLSDIFYVILTLLGMASLLKTDDFKLWMAIFGSVMLVGYALYSWFKQPKMATEESILNDPKAAKYIFRGLLLNGLNPFIIVSWATWVSAITVNFDYNFEQQVQFFGGMLITIFCLDLSKAFVAHRLKHLITLKFIRNMNRTIAVILLLFTTRILVFIWENYLV